MEAVGLMEGAVIGIDVFAKLDELVEELLRIGGCGIVDKGFLLQTLGLKVVVEEEVVEARSMVGYKNVARCAVANSCLYL